MSTFHPVQILSSNSSIVFPLHTALTSLSALSIPSASHAHHLIRSLRLSNTNRLSAPFVHTSFGARSFSVAAPKIWNSILPPSNVYQPRHFSSSSQDSLFPAGLPILLAPQMRLLLTIVRVYLLIHIIIVATIAELLLVLLLSWIKFKKKLCDANVTCAQ